MIQRDKKEKEKAKFIMETKSSENTSESESESESESGSETKNQTTTITMTTTTTQERSGSPINTPNSQTVVANAVKYLNSSKHRINKYNNDFPSLSGSSTSSAAAVLEAASSSNNKNNNPYDRSQKNKFKPMSQKLKSQEEFPSLQSSVRKKNNSQIKQPRGKHSVLRIV